MKIWLNGSFHEANETGFSIDNRALNYGDGVFETMRFMAGSLPFAQQHLSRIKKSLRMLDIQVELPNVSRLIEIAQTLAQLNGAEGAMRVKLMVFRAAGGFYTPTQNTGNVLITAVPLDHESFVLNAKGLKVGIFASIKKPNNLLSGIKSNNALLYVLAGKYAKDQHWDDSLILNEANCIAEGTASNLFIVNHYGELITPSTDQGFIHGIMRDVIVHLAELEGFRVREQALTTNDLLMAKEVFLTNSIQGIQWVLAYEDKRYFNRISKQLTAALNEHIINDLLAQEE